MTATSLRVMFSLWLLVLVGSPSQAADDISAFAETAIQQYAQLKSAGENGAANKLLKNAASQLQQHLDRQPDSSQVRLGLMGIQALLEDYPAALGNIEILIDQRPDVGLLHYTKARLLLSARQFDDAERSIRRAMKLEPRTATPILLEFGRGLNAAGRSEQALAIAREAKKLDPNSEGPVLLMAQVAFRAENFGEWEKGLRAAITNHPEHKRLRAELIGGLLDLQKLDKAYEECLVVVKLEPDNFAYVPWLIRLAPHLSMPINPQPHVDRLYELHRAGKFPESYFLREDFSVDRKEITAWEYFDVDRHSIKFLFRLTEERCEVTLAKYEETNQFLRLAEESPLSGVTYVLDVERDFKRERYREFQELPKYQEVRALAVEIFKGKTDAK